MILVNVHTTFVQVLVLVSSTFSIRMKHTVGFAMEEFFTFDTTYLRSIDRYGRKIKTTAKEEERRRNDPVTVSTWDTSGQQCVGVTPTKQPGRGYMCRNNATSPSPFPRHILPVCGKHNQFRIRTGKFAQRRRYER